MNGLIRRRLYGIALVLSAVLAVGTLGLVIIEHADPFDAFYMALITVTTIGYGEIVPLHRAGRIFNTFYVFFGVIGLLLSVGALTQTMLELELSGYFPRRRTRRMIEQTKNHIIVCGYGRVGRGAVEELRKSGTSCVVVDLKEERVEAAMRAGVLAVMADCSRDDVLREVGIDRARGLIASLGTDADNLFLVMSAKTLNPQLRVSTRVAEEESEGKLRRAGADEVLAPYNFTGARLAQSLIRPHVLKFLDLTTMNQELKVSLEQVSIPAESEFADKALRDIQLRRDFGVIVLAIRRANGLMLFNPGAETLISADDNLIVMGHDADLAAVAQLMNAGTVKEVE